MWLEADSTLRAEVREHGVAEAPALPDAPIAALMPASAEAFDVRTDASAGDLLASWLLETEERLDRTTLKASFDDSAGAQAITAAIARYYAEFDEFREQFLNVAPTRFAPGAAWAVGTRGAVKRFGIEVEAEGQRWTVQGTDLPVVEFVLVGRAKDPARAERLARDIYRAWVKGVRALAGGEGDATANGRALVESADLGLGRPTWVFGGGWVERLASGQGLKLALTAEGDLQPHYFFVDDHLVFSTSPRLSAEIIAAAERDRPAVSLPAVEGRLVRLGHVPGHTVAASFRYAAAWVAALTKDVPIDSLRRGGRVLTTLGNVLDLVGVVSWQATQQGPTQITRATVTFD